MVHRVVHFEIPIDEPDRAGPFYRDTFGWTVTPFGDAGYWTLTTGEPPGVGAEGALTAREGAPEGVLIYVGVDDITSTLAKVTEAGGKVEREREEIPGIGFWALFRDPEGNLLGLFETPPGERPAAGG
jgi:uncharacterized protein